MIDLFSTPKGNANVLNSLLRSLKVKVTSSSVYSCLHEHPDYPSLLSFSDCLREWKVPNVAYHIDKDEYNASNLSFPLLGHITGERHKFVVIHDIREGQVIYSDEKYKKATMFEADFLQQWDGIVVYPEAKPESGEKGYAQSQTKAVLNAFRLPLLVLFAGLLIADLFFKHDFTLAYAGVTLTTLMGTVISILLLMHSVNANNQFLQNLCSLGNKNNCNAILKSDSAKITGWLSWSEVGFFYFSGFLLSLLLVANSLQALAVLNILCLPYTFWSIWHQYRVRNWCALCCGVQAVLWLQFAFLFPSMERSLLLLDFRTITGLAACFLAPILVWTYVKPVVLKAEEVNPLRQQVNKFKYNVELFNQLLHKQPRVEVPDALMPITLGNASAPVTITMVSNPYCGPCAKAHKFLDDWLAQRDNIKLVVIFTASSQDEVMAKTSRHLASLGVMRERGNAGAALNNWYEDPVKDYERWAKDYPFESVDGLDKITQKQKEWCNEAKVTYTPTILINGRRLPEPYRLEDLKYFLN